MSPKPKILHQWQQPQKINRFLADEKWKSEKKSIPHIIIAIIVISFPLYIFFKNVSPDELDIPWDKIFIIFYIVSISFVTIMFVVDSFLARFFRTNFLITEKGIRISSGQNVFFVPWARIQGYWLSQHEQFPELTMLILHTKKWKRTLILPEDEQADKITETISERTPKVEPKEPVEKPRTSLTKLQYIYLVTLTMVYSVFLTYVIVETGSRSVQLAFIYLALLLGPGTLGSIHMFGFKCFKDKGIKEATILFNLIACGIIFLLPMLYLYYRYCKIIEGG
ncbi:MAG TPA: hypothetical protein HPP87_09620 [Planctomycetes bacterium]|nr:hypothetical protein [Planctomycetota bacterium]